MAASGAIGVVWQFWATPLCQHINGLLIARQNCDILSRCTHQRRGNSAPQLPAPITTKWVMRAPTRRVAGWHGSSGQRGRGQNQNRPIRRILVMPFKRGPGNHRGIVGTKGGRRHRQTKAVFSPRCPSCANICLFAATPPAMTSTGCVSPRQLGG